MHENFMREKIMHKKITRENFTRGKNKCEKGDLCEK